VFVGFLSTPDSADKFNQHSEAIRASLGLRMSSLDALRSVSVTGPCVTLAGQYIAACSTIAQLSGEQERLANRIVELLSKATGFEAVNLGQVLAALAPQVKGQAKRLALLTKFVEQRRAMPCDSAVVNAGKSELLVDMLKWPVCTGRGGLMLRIAEIQGSQPTEFGEFKEPGKRSTFNGDLRRFIAWLKMQRNSNGKPFDTEGPPTWSPGHVTEAPLP
jgi:hypothetical protein